MGRTEPAIQEQPLNGKPRLRASLGREHNIKSVDLFVDYTGRQSDLNIVPGRMGPFSDYLRDMLTPITCPSCGSQEVRRSRGNLVADWMLGISGRKTFSCSSCSWKEVVKVFPWQWEVVACGLFTLAIVTFASIHWILR